MVDKEFRKALNNFAQEMDVEVKILDNSAFDKSIIGISDDGRVIYSYEKMVQEFMEDEGVDEMEAIEWIDYNTVRALPYMGEGAPIIVANTPETIKEYYGN